MPQWQSQLPIIGTVTQYPYLRHIKNDFSYTSGMDINYEEDSRAQVDSNVILTSSGKIVDFQTTSEGEPYEYEKMLELFNIAKTGIGKIISLY